MWWSQLNNSDLLSPCSPGAGIRSCVAVGRSIEPATQRTEDQNRNVSVYHYIPLYLQIQYNSDKDDLHWFTFFVHWFLWMRMSLLLSETINGESPNSLMVVPQCPVLIMTYEGYSVGMQIRMPHPTLAPAWSNEALLRAESSLIAAASTIPQILWTHVDIQSDLIRMYVTFPIAAKCNKHPKGRSNSLNKCAIPEMNPGVETAKKVTSRNALTRLDSSWIYCLNPYWACAQACTHAWSRCVAWIRVAGPLACLTLCAGMALKDFYKYVCKRIE